MRAPHQWMILLIASAVLALAPVGAAAEVPIPPECVYEKPCVYVTPDVDPKKAKPGTVLTFHGRGWRPRTRIKASYGSYCPPGAPGTICAGVGLSTRFRADREGRFAFTFRFGNRPPRGVRGPVGAGSEEVRFDARAPNRRRVQRTAVPPPPPSTPEERAQAAAVRDAVRTLAADIDRAPPRTAKAVDVQQRDVGRCRRIIRIERPKRRAAVIERVVDASLAAATYGEAGPEFAAFADRLEALRLTDPVLAAGAAAWTNAVRAPRYVPTRTRTSSAAASSS